MANVLLPRFVALQNDGRYLQYVEEEGELHGFLRFSGNEVLSPYAKFQVERAQSSEILVHMRSCYNNKYLVRRTHLGQTWIVAEADEPEEDHSKQSCTLIYPRPSTFPNQPPNTFIFSLQRYSGMLWRSQRMNSSNLNAPNYLMIHSDTGSWIRVIDMDSLAILPRYFTFKGDNGKYLRLNEFFELQYVSDDIRESKVHYEAFTTPEGNVRIRSKVHGDFWKLHEGKHIYVDSSDNSADNLDTVFQPIRLYRTGKKLIALKNLGNNKYCKRTTKDLFNAGAEEVIPEAEIEVEETVHGREIFDVCYRTSDARFYDSKPVIILTKDVVNRSPTSTQTGEVPFTYNETHTQTWDSNNSWKAAGVTTNVTAGIPFVEADKEISIKGSYDGQVSWGESKETSREIGTKVEVQVPPMTNLKVGMIIRKAAIDMPFSYTQRDTLLDGSIVTTRMHDGFFSGVNTHINYDIKEEPLSSNSLTAPAAKL